MRVTAFRAKNFLILKDLSLGDLKMFNVFIGPNATGKSTVLQALDLLLESNSIGLSSDSTFRGSPDLPVELLTKLKFSAEDADVAIRDAVDRERRLPPPDKIAVDLREKLAMDATFGIGAVAPRLPEQGAMAFAKYVRVGTQPFEAALRQGLTGETAQWLSQERQLFGPLEPAIMRVAEQRTVYLPTTRSAAHSFGIGRPTKPAPSTVGQWLHAARGEKSPRFEGYEAKLSEMLRHARGVIFRPDQGNQMRWGISEEGLPGMTPAEFWSSGTRHLSMFLGMMSQAPKGTVALVEEPELSLHPSAITKLVREMHGLADAGSTQFFITTHSPIVTYGLDPTQKDHSLWSFERESDGSASAARCESEQEVDDAIKSLLGP